MLMTIFDSLSSYWTSFIEAPLPFQVVLAAGAVTAFGAAKTGWKILFPVRWVTAKTLRGTAYLLHHTENAAVNASNRLSGVNKFAATLEGAIMPEVANFNCDSHENYLRTLKFYNKKMTVRSLSDDELKLLLKLGTESVYSTDYRKEKVVYGEKARREAALDAAQVLKQVEEARVAVIEKAQRQSEDGIRKKIALEQQALENSQRKEMSTQAAYEQAFAKANNTGGYTTSKKMPSYNY